MIAANTVETLCQSFKTGIIFGPFFDLWEFFKNQGFALETSVFNFCDLLEELFHMAEKLFFEKKSNYQKLFWRPI